MKRILVLCTGNSCRSQMAEAFLRSFDPQLEVHSAGTRPADAVHPKAIQVMAELGIDLSKNHPKLVDHYLNEAFDFVITVCDHARETCPVFTGKVTKQLHIGFEDPADVKGSEDEVLKIFRRVRNEIKTDFKDFYETNLNTQGASK